MLPVMIFAQNVVDFGIKEGVNFSCQCGTDGEGIYDTSARRSTTVAVMFNFPLSGGEISIQPEIMFNTKGMRYKGDSFFEGKNKFEYISLPVMFQWNIHKGFYVEAGPEVGFMIHNNVEVKMTSSANEKLNKLEAAANVGLGYRFDNGIVLGARYSNGITNVVDRGSDSSINSVKNKNVQVSIGYFL